ncbi:MAG: hypothetical protein KGH99_06470 [Thaumarchaeota archaeon]|nr:hypothetical protein [Nitrososphaerota archaeon]
MEEIALVFSSLAGACTAVALDKIPKRKYKQTVTVNSAVEDQLHSLKIEKDILTKTIARLHHEESSVSRVQRDKLLIRYQHQLGATISKIEKLEAASKYPDLGPIGDSLVTLMDNKLSKMDQRLHEISSKISVNTVQPQVQTIVQPAQVKQQEQPKQIVQERPRIEKIEPKIEYQQERIEIQEEIIDAPKEDILPPIEIPAQARRRSIELSTLTEIPSRMPDFPSEIMMPQETIEPEKIIEPVKETLEIPQSIIPVEPTPLVPKEEIVAIGVPKPEAVVQVEKKIQLPTPIKIPEEEKIEDDDKDLDKIKSEIMKALSKLEQVEVE